MKRRVMMGKNVGMPDDNTVFLLNFDKGWENLSLKKDQ